MARVYNFSAGPSMLPESVLRTAQAEMLEYGSSGQSVMEMSHRSSVYDAIIKETEAALRRVLCIPDNYKVGFIQGGASTQFAMVPMLSLSGIYRPRKDGSIRFPTALEQYLKDNPGVARIVLCLDNDGPGRTASAAIQKRLSEYEVIDNPPRSGKDYNDRLRLMKGISGRVRTRGGDAR